MSYLHNPNSPHNVMNGVLYCNNEKLDNMNREIYDRNIPSRPLQMSFDPRQVQTRYVRFPAIDCKTPTNVPIEHRGAYNQHGQFNPGTSAPFQGYASNIDQDSRLKDMFAPLQKFTGQSEYIPSSNSELYKDPVMTNTKPTVMNHPMLFAQEHFAPFNPNVCDLGGKVLYNHTRQQVKDVKMK